ncbi:hypothetical protein ACFXG4_30705 [Nocardia sp. NPDC059246]|uniref:hypothetical protein n=1 Tax=unclassified Nocardia TaxID=2637762 RepID=UPI0036736DFF
MSDNGNPVDEIAAEARKFSVAMMAAMRRHTQAAGWLERRKARKEISRLIRQEQREQAQARTDNLTWTNQAVDRYRAHVQAVTARAADPSVDHARRARDVVALARHRDELAGQFVSNGHLTRTEQGIALDGLDAVTVFPEYATGDLFSRAHKVKGVEALHYRARVARETVSMRERAETERVAWEASVDAARRANWEQSELARIENAQPDQHRYAGELTWTDEQGGVTMAERQWFPTEHVATEWIGRSIDHSLWTEGTTVQVRTVDRHNAATQYSERGRPEVVADQLAAREAMLRERTLAGQVHRDQAPVQAREAGQESGRRIHSIGESGRVWTADEAGWFGSHAPNTVAGFEAKFAEVQRRAFHDISEGLGWSEEIEHARFGLDHSDALDPQARARAREILTVTETEAKLGQRPDRDLWQAVIDPAEFDRWSGLGERGTREKPHQQASQQQAARPVSAKTREVPDWAEGVAAQINELADQRDTLLEQTKQLTRITEDLTAERDRLRGERDEAVQKLAERTPASERYGSPERQAEQAKAAARQSAGSALADYQHGSALADAVARNGHDREGIER